MMKKNYHHVEGKLLAQPGQGEVLLQILLEAARGMEAVEDCFCYLVGTRAEEPDAVYVIEVWKDAAAHQASLALPVFQALIARARPLLAGMEDVPSLVIHGGRAKAL